MKRLVASACATVGKIVVVHGRTHRCRVKANDARLQCSVHDGIQLLG